MSSLWGGGGGTAGEAKQTGEEAKEQADKQADEQAEAKSARPKTRPVGAMKRMPSERPRFGKGTSDNEWVERAEKRMKALNPSGCIDYFLPSDGINQYLDALTAHQDYWVGLKLRLAVAFAHGIARADKPVSYLDRRIPDSARLCSRSSLPTSRTSKRRDAKRSASRRKTRPRIRRLLSSRCITRFPSSGWLVSR